MALRLWCASGLNFRAIAAADASRILPRSHHTQGIFAVRAYQTAHVQQQQQQQQSRAGVIPKKLVKQPAPTPKGPNRLLTAGLPFVLFSVLAAWVVSNAISGKLKEREKSLGLESRSIRQAELEAEHDEMMERLSKIVKQDFDNTKRIKRPEEILEERRLERERRNKWYRRLYRWITRQEQH
jgi:hypothetical protein